VLAAAIALTLFDSTSADAAVKGRAIAVRKVPSRVVQPRARVVQPRVKQVGKITKGTPGLVKKGTSTALVKKGTSTSFPKKSVSGTGKLTPRSLPLHKAAAGNNFLKARLAVPQNIKPKLTLTKSPALKFHPHFAPFVQRHWKKAFFWIAVAGIGYLTIPEL